MKQEYFALTHLIERLHRRYLDVIRAQLKELGIRDINAVQSLLLTNIGDQQIQVRDLVERGYYLGSNVSYNLRKMVDCGYLEQKPAPHDRRSTIVMLTEKGQDLAKQLSEIEASHGETLSDKTGDEAIGQSAKVLQELERVWADYIHFGR